MILNLSSEKDYAQQVSLLNIVSSLAVYAVLIIGEGFEINMFFFSPHAHHNPFPPSTAGQFVTQKYW